MVAKEGVKRRRVEGEVDLLGTKGLERYSNNQWCIVPDIASRNRVKGKSSDITSRAC